MKSIMLTLFLILFGQSGYAQEMPLWEVGLGFTGLSLPEYRGADTQLGYVFPLPYLVYRGDILKVDRKGIYGLLLDSETVQLNISLDAGAPVRNSGNTMRSGMNDLGPTFQIGPSLEICLMNTCGGDRSVQLRFPVRAVYAFNNSRLRGIGWVVNPQINTDIKNIGSKGAWNAGVAIGPIFGTESYHSYYYDVATQFAMPGRPSYDAHGGYSGSIAALSLSKRFERHWFGAFARYDNLANAAFVDSPLVKTRHSFMVGFGIAWILNQSSTLVRE